MQTDGGNEAFPQSMRHRQILDVADEHPEESIDELASLVPSATPELVERVLDKYGDPAVTDEHSSDLEDTMPSSNGTTDGSDTETAEATANSHAETADSAQIASSSEGTTTTSSEETQETETEHTSPSLENLTHKQQQLVNVVAAHPSATQEDLAQHFDVTRATISRWANNIEGFDWRERESFVEAVVDDPPAVDLALDEDTVAETTSSTAESVEETQQLSTDTVVELNERVATLETEIERLTDQVDDLQSSHERSDMPDDAVFEDPELVHKIVHACLESAQISESEELRLLRALLD